MANRGEIAVRIFRTCRELGIETVAVAAPDDLGSLHARSADEVVEIASYLHSEEHIRAALAAAPTRSTPATGSSPRTRPSPRRWGPPGSPGSGRRPRRFGSVGTSSQPSGSPARPVSPCSRTDRRRRSASRSLVKAAAGGGGRGMRVVRSPAELDEALAAAEREAEGAFGDGTLYCERYLERPRHVEVQLLADSHGNVVALGERDCSVQRRHQKVLEESPAPQLDRRFAAELHGRQSRSAVRSGTGAQARSSSSSTATTSSSSS